MTKINKPAGFWIRFLARLIDLVIFLAVVIGSAFALLKKGQWDVYVGKTLVHQANGFHFETAGSYYGWLIASVGFLIVLFIVVPMLTNGRTLAMLICRIKIDFKEDKTKPWIKRFLKRFVPLFKREAFMSLTIAINMLLILAVFNVDLFNKFTYFSKNRLSDGVKDITTGKDLTTKDIFTTLESLSVAIVTTFASILFIVQIIIALSIIVRKGKGGFHDSFSKTRTIWEKRTIEIKDEKQDDAVTSFKPRLIKKETIEWIE